MSVGAYITCTWLISQVIMYNTSEYVQYKYET